VNAFPKETVDSLLIRNIPRDLAMGVEDALRTGAQRGFGAGVGMNPGHRSNAVGQMRHFHMNETFRDALEAAGANPSPIKGNSVVVGRAGVLMLGRFNISNNVWNNGRRSRARREMSLANRAIEPLVTPDLFEVMQPITKAAVFFVAVFDRSVQDSLAIPISIDIAVPDHQMMGWLYRKSIASFLELYETPVETQLDLAKPTLKVGVAVAQQQQGTRQ
jgi:hypothetical protein